MKNTLYSVTVFWDKRRMDTKTKEGNIFLTVNLMRRQFRITLKLKSTKEDFDKAVSSARILNDKAKELKKEMADYLAKAEAILTRLPNPTKESFTRLFKSETDHFMTNKTDMLYFFDEKMNEALKEGRVGTYKYYKGCLNSFKSFSKDLYFEDITEKWLKRYRNYLKNNGNADATISLRLRCMKIMFNLAIEGGYISSKHYPFKNISTGSSVKSKSVLYPEQLRALWLYQPKTMRQHRAKAYWFFCYLSNGMNFKDMAHLKWKDMKGDTFTFIRQKTKLTTKTGTKEIRVHLNDVMKKIIKVWGKPSNNQEDFIFPIIKDSSDCMQMEKARVRMKRMCNKKLSTMGKELGFDVHLCLNLARHSFATMLKLSNTPTSFISDAMGHTSSKTTEHYLKSIPDKQLEIMSNKLLAFREAI